MPLPEFDPLLFDPALFDTSGPVIEVPVDFFTVPAQIRFVAVPVDHRLGWIPPQTRSFDADQTA